MPNASAPLASQSWSTSSRSRGAILILLLASLAINLIDRQVLSVLAPVLRDELPLTNTEYSYIVFSFLLGMTVTQIPAGILLDRFGLRLVLPLLVLFWSPTTSSTISASKRL